MDRDRGGRDLLFGVTALHMSFITQEQFLEVMALLPVKPGRSAEDLLSEKGYLKPFQLKAIEGLIGAQLEMHGGDVAKSISAFEGTPAIDQTMALIGERPAGQKIRETRQTIVLTRQGEDRYVLGRELGRGGLGKVVIAMDRDLMDREVAMKLMLPGAASERHSPSPSTPPSRERFLEEAQITGQLWHPNIVAVLELGTRPSGEPYYTMPVVRGQTLRKTIREAHRKIESGEVRVDDWGVERLRLLSAFQDLCNAIGYAHSRGVIHRDLKSANVMVGSFGETIVVDWGLAKVIGGRERTPETGAISGEGIPSEKARPGADRKLEKMIQSLRDGGDHQTMEGTITGTPSYMAPEQAAGRIAEIDEQSDTYSLGAILFEILTGSAPYQGKSTHQIIGQVLAPSPPPDPRDHREKAPVPDDLAAVCLKAMAKRKRDRYESALALLADVTAAIEGGKERQRRHAEAERLVAAGRERARDYLDLRKEYGRLQDAAKEAGKPFKGGEPVGEKAGWWTLQDEAEVAGRAVLGTFAEAERFFHQALEQEHGHATAREGLADLHYGQFRIAEDAENNADFQYYGDLVRTYHDGKYARELRGDGTISIATDPEGAEVYLYRYEARERRLIPVPWKASTGWAPELGEGEVATTAGWYLEPRREALDAFVGLAPVTPLDAPMGSYMAIVRLGGYRDVRRPVHVGRNEDVRVAVKLYAEDEIGGGFLYVPGGPFIAGGDSRATSSWPRQVKEVEGFFIARFPVTCEEYLAFLNDLGARAPAEARRHAPRWQDEGGMHWIEEPEGLWRIPVGKDPQGMIWKPDEPVVEVNWHDANAYCAWRSEKEGREVRLPHEVEWEKAARGVDGRLFAWGSHFDASWCNISLTRLEGGSRRGPIGEFPVDESPYGVRDLGGNVQDWCSDLIREDQEWRVLRGGYWYGGDLYCRSASRLGIVPSLPNMSFGFRVVVAPRSLRQVQGGLAAD